MLVGELRAEEAEPGEETGVDEGEEEDSTEALGGPDEDLTEALEGPEPLDFSYTFKQARNSFSIRSCQKMS